MSKKKNSPFKFIGAGAAINIGMGIWGKIQGDQAATDARNRETDARNEMNRLKEIYANLDTSNPFLNMENKFEDLTINQKASEFQRQTFQQSQANILGSLRGSAGSSGIASLAQSLSQQGQLASQKAAADIGAQERQNIMAERQEASRIQGMERQGEVQSRQMELNKQSTLLGMAQAETAAYAQQAAEAEAQGWSALAGGIGGAVDLGVAGMGFGGEGAPASQKYLNDNTINPAWTNAQDTEED